MITDAKWISPSMELEDSAAEFEKQFIIHGHVQSATLTVTAIGVYDAYLNGTRVGDFILAPGCTAYDKRLQYQSYDIAPLLQEKNDLVVTVGKGWHRSRMTWKRPELKEQPCALIAEIAITYADGSQKVWMTDERWIAGPSRTIKNDLWDGETYDATMALPDKKPVNVVSLRKDILIRQEGPFVKEQEIVAPRQLIITPNGQKVIDFGQEITGYIAFEITAKKGERVVLSCAEMLDHDGNFYRENYRTAQSLITYICREGKQRYHPRFTFYGFRYIRLDEYPGEIDLNAFQGIVLYSEMERTGYVQTSDEKLNRLYANALWSQRGNFVDIPTDCPQRDERMGWTGDAQVFAKTACYNYNAKQFFEKWLGDLRADQRADGSIPDTVPNFWGIKRSSAAWGDVMTVLPWRLYLMYGDRNILKDNFDAMKRWVDYITNDTQDAGLWTSPDDSDLKWQKHYGDWLALDAVEGSYRGSTPNDFIASVYYAYSTRLLIQAGKALGKDMASYEALYSSIVTAFKKRFHYFSTQTEHVLALVFDLTDDKPAVANALAEMIRKNRTKLKTGFVGTPYLLYALSENGYADVAYDLLLQEEYPSWLYEVNHGATTIWEHWDGLKEDGTFWNAEMNSFNHYAYGSVIDWVYSVAGGIRPDENNPGFEHAMIAPVPSDRISWMEVAYHSVKGKISSKWFHTEKGVTYEIITPVPATICIQNRVYDVQAGTFLFYSC